MTARELQAFLHANIPATAALSLSVVDITPDSLILSTPHAPNRNHKNTVFGGSIALAATVGGWAMVHSRFPKPQATSSSNKAKPATCIRQTAT